MRLTPIPICPLGQEREAGAAVLHLGCTPDPLKNVDAPPIPLLPTVSSVWGLAEAFLHCKSFLAILVCSQVKNCILVSSWEPGRHISSSEAARPRGRSFPSHGVSATMAVLCRGIGHTSHMDKPLQTPALNAKHPRAFDIQRTQPRFSESTAICDLRATSPLGRPPHA